MAQWNLSRLAECLLFLFDGDEKVAIEKAKTVLDEFAEFYLDNHHLSNSRKLGFNQATSKELVDDILHWLALNKLDYTLFWHRLGKHLESMSADALLQEFSITDVQQKDDFSAWFTRWQKSLDTGNCRSTASVTMQQSNPVLIQRNHRVVEAIEAAEENNFQPLKRLLKALEMPYLEHESLADLMLPAKDSERVTRTFCGVELTVLLLQPQEHQHLLLLPVLTFLC